jgi:SAM-dependent methyltransferase
MQCTQRKNTIGTYRKLKRLILPGAMVLDYGSGYGLGATLLHADAFEPNAREGVWPTYTQPHHIPASLYDVVVCNCVLNVVDKWEDRVEIMNHIVRALKPGGCAYIMARSHRDVGDIKHKTAEGDGWRLKNGAFQRGYGRDELRGFLVPFGEVTRIFRINSIGFCLTTPTP